MTSEHHPGYGVQSFTGGYFGNPLSYARMSYLKTTGFSDPVTYWKYRWNRAGIDMQDVFQSEYDAREHIRQKTRKIAWKRHKMPLRLTRGNARYSGRSNYRRRVSRPRYGRGRYRRRRYRRYRRRY